MKVKIRGVDVRNLSVPLEQIEGAIPVLAEMINDLRGDLRDTTTSLLEVGDTAQVETFRVIDATKEAINNAERHAALSVSNTQEELLKTIYNVQREIWEEIDSLREEIFTIMDNTWHRRLWKFLNRDIKLGRI